MDVYGHGFTKDSQVILSTSIGELGEDCKSDETHIKTNLYSLSNVSPDGTSAILLVSVTTVFEFEKAELLGCGFFNIRDHSKTTWTKF